MGKFLFSTDDSDKIKEVVREAESRLEAQREIATAADQRALTFAGLLVATVAALIGAATASGAVANHAPALLSVASALFVAAGFALWSARPTPWELVGNAPSQWLDDLQSEHDTLSDCLAVMAEFYDVMISKNATAIDRAAGGMKRSLGVTGLAILAGLAWAWWIVLTR